MSSKHYFVYLTQEDIPGLYPPTELLVKPKKTNKSYARIAHFSPDTPSLNVYIDNMILGGDIDYTERTLYRLLEQGSHTITVYPAGEKEPILDDTFIMPQGTIITIALIIKLEELSLEIINDSTRILPNEIVAKFVNYSPNSPNLDALINDTEYFSEIIYDQVTSYVTLPDATNYNLKLRNSDTGEIILELPNIVLSPNKAYTFYVIGLYEDTPPLQVVTTLDGSSYLLDE
ncbi:MAG: DUF4397 domain-containing protein [Eubacteriales bacterium]